MPRTPKMSAKERKREKKRQMMARESIAAFFTATAAIIGHAYWFTVRGDCELGLGLTMMLSLEEYDALLLVSGLINVKHRSGGGYRVEVPIEGQWKPFLKDYNIWGCNSICEMTISQVKVGAFKRRKKGDPIGAEVADLHLLRIGRYHLKGEVSIASKQLMYGIDPPNLNRFRNMRTIQRRLHLAVKPIVCHIVRSTDCAIEAKLKSIVE